MSRFFYCLLTLLLFTGCKTQQQKCRAALQQAQLQWASGQRELAQDSLEMLSQQYPDNPELFELLAQWEEEQGHCLEAALYLERAAQLDVNQPELRLRCAALYEFQAHWEAALRNYQEYLRRFPKKAHVWCCVAYVHKQLNHTEQALKAFFKYFDLTPLGQEQAWMSSLKDFEALVALSQDPAHALRHGLREAADSPLWRLMDLLMEQSHWDALRQYRTALVEVEKGQPAFVEPNALARLDNALRVHEEAEAFRRKNVCVSQAQDRHRKRAAPLLTAHHAPTRTQHPVLVIRLEDNALTDLPDYETLVAQALEPELQKQDAPAAGSGPAVASPHPVAIIVAAPQSPRAAQAMEELSNEKILTQEEALDLKSAAETLKELGHPEQARCLYKLALRFLDSNEGPWCQAALALVALENASL